MIADKAQLLGLIGLRALAERDPVEYRRVADLSKPELDRRIKTLLEKLSDPECDALYHQMVDVTESSESLPEADMLLRQIYLTSLQKSQYQSLLAAKEQSPTERSLPSDIIETNIHAAGLQWDSTRRREMKPNLLALDSIIAEEKSSDVLFDCLGEIAHSLARKKTLAGSEEPKKSVVWQSCVQILRIGGRQFRTGISANDLWNAIREGDAAAWLMENTYEIQRPTAQTARAKNGSVS